MVKEMASQSASLTGASKSITVTTAVAELELLLPSVTVRITVFSPRLLLLKVVLSVVKVNGPQASAESLFTASCAMVALPLASN